MIIVYQFLLSVLDLIAISLLGLVSSLALTGIQSKNNLPQVQNFLELVGIDDLSLQSQVATVTAFAGTLLILKTIVSAWIYKRILFFLSLRAAAFGHTVLEAIVQSDYSEVRKHSPNTILFVSTRGAQYLLSGVLGSVIQLSTDFVLLIVIFCGLSFFNLTLTISAIIYFLLISIYLIKRIGQRAQRIQSEVVDEVIESERKILELTSLFKELFVRNALKNQLDEIRKLREKAAIGTATGAFMPYFSKYWLEISFVTGGILLGGIQFLVTSGVEAITTLSVFIVAATRIMPALLRIQNGIILYKASVGSSQSTVAVYKDIERAKKTFKEPENLQTANSNFQRAVEFQNVFFSYSSNREMVLKNVSLEIRNGEFFSIVGPSGAGKSTIIDLSLGLYNPLQGTVRINGMAPKDFIRAQPGDIGYVAQESVFSDKSVKENLTLGMNTDDFSVEELFEVLEKVSLGSFVKQLPNQLEEIIGHRGANMSLGQRQRLSLARALVSKPKILFLDEATSSLDVETESEISEYLDSLRGNITIVVIAHRLSTVRNSDRILFLKNGEVAQVGTFETLKSTNSDFADMVKLSAL